MSPRQPSARTLYSTLPVALLWSRVTTGNRQTYRRPSPPRIEEGLFRWEGIDLNRLADERPTPFFLFSETRLIDNLASVTRGLGASRLPAVIRYCAKTNPELAIQEKLASAGASMLASTPEEVALALEAGFTAERIAYQRPVLGGALRDAVGFGVRFVHAYRLSDLAIIEQAAAKAGVTLSVSLRIRDERGGMRILGSAAQRLGLSPDEAVDAAGRFVSLPHLNLVALNSYIGTQQPGLARFSSSIQLLCSTAVRIRKSCGIEIEEVNIGGGIPSDTLRRVSLSNVLGRVSDSVPEPRMALDEFASGVGEILKRELQTAPFVRRVAAEPGRSIVGNAAVLVTRVMEVQGRWLFLDASHNYLCESPLLFNRRIDAAPKRGNDGYRYYNLSGCTLNTLDVIDWRRRLPPLDRGDLLVISDAGAYSLARAARYAGMSPAAYMIDRDGEIRTVRRAETHEDLAAAMTRRQP